MEKLEKFIYSFKYLPPLLYFGSAGLLGYDIYCQIFSIAELLNVYTRIPVIIVFCLMTWWGVNRLQKK